MAVILPIVLAATGASAAISAAIGVSAALVTVGATVIAAATGITAKIDAAASKVFGEDLVWALVVPDTMPVGPAARQGRALPVNRSGVAACGPNQRRLGAGADTHP